jgi:ubiquinone/menaquinone biosynthesis C-methylase UbiE
MTTSTVPARKPDAELPFDAPSAAAYDQFSHSTFFRAERLRFMRELGKFKPSGSLLDIGCGPGYLLNAIAKRYPALSLSGLDISQDMLDLARINLGPGVNLIQADAASIPLQDGSIDFVVSSGSLHHWGDAPAVVKEMRRILAPGGRFLIMDLRRDTPAVLRFAASLGNRFVPPELQRTRGVMGSLESAYTPAELRSLVSAFPFAELRISTGLAWMFASGKK